MIGDGGAHQADFGPGRTVAELVLEGGQGAVPDRAIDKPGGAEAAAPAAAPVDLQEEHAAEFRPRG